MNLTTQQQAVLDAVRKPGRLAINAVAGSGKTTTIVQAASVAKDVGLVAFNRHIATELKGRVGSGADVCTMHSLGFRVLQKTYPGIRLEEKKLNRVILERMPGLHRAGTGKWAGRHFLKPEWKALPDVVRVAKQQATCDRVIVRAACQSQGVDRFDDGILKLAEEIFHESIEDTSSCDFDDMIAMPVVGKLIRSPLFGTLFVDEAQDLSPAQQELAIASGERLVIVGDPRQAIMAFAGADSDAFPRMIKRLPGCTELPLSR